MPVGRGGGGHPHSINSTTPTTGILYSPQFRLHQETKMAAGRTQRSTSTILRKNRGREQSTSLPPIPVNNLTNSHPKKSVYL